LIGINPGGLLSIKNGLKSPSTFGGMDTAFAVIENVNFCAWIKGEIGLNSEIWVKTRIIFLGNDF
jgi:hypothetical protein